MTTMAILFDATDEYTQSVLEVVGEIDLADLESILILEAKPEISTDDVGDTIGYAGSAAIEAPGRTYQRFGYHCSMRSNAEPLAGSGCPGAREGFSMSSCHTRPLDGRLLELYAGDIAIRVLGTRAIDFERNTQMPSAHAVNWTTADLFDIFGISLPIDFEFAAGSTIDITLPDGRVGRLSCADQEQAVSSVSSAWFEAPRFGP